MILKSILDRIGNILARKRLPRVVTITKFVSKGCRFEISTSVEAYRVERFGGEEHFTETILDELSPSDMLFDIGACVGMVAVHAASMGATVVAFEPDPGYRERLYKNLLLNELGNVKVVEWAVSDKAGEAVLYTDGIQGNSPSLREVGARGSVRVRTDSIDNALSREEFPSPSVLKIDVEGAETLVIKGMLGLLKSDRPPRAIFIETHPEFLPLFGSQEGEVSALLEGCGYVQKYKNRRLDQVHYFYKRPAS